MADNWYFGNASEDAADHRGWLLGHFLEPSGQIRQTDTLEVKWGVHPAGDKRAAPTEGETRTTLVVLVSGRFRIDLSVGSRILDRQGDYAVWGEGIDHSWEAIEDSIVITVRWPSIIT